MNFKSVSIVVCLFFLTFSGLINAQQTSAYSEPYEALKQGAQLFDQGLFAASKPYFESVLKKRVQPQEANFAQLEMQSRLYLAKVAVRMQTPEAESLVLNFIQTYSQDPIAVEATSEIANFYYSDQQYEKAIQYYTMLDGWDLTPAQQAEAQFKRGYCHFVMKDFAAAKTAFNQTKNIQSDYFFPTNYYLGMTEFFEGDYNLSVKYFERAQNSPDYQPYVPYYIAQISFAQGNYDQVIETGEKSLKQEVLQNKKEIHHLVGKAYFENGEFAKSLSHLEYYESRSGKMRAEDFYQLGFVQYQLGHCEKAASNFKELTQLETTMGQQANYYMADCYINAGDLTSARTAFRKVSLMDFDPKIKEEAQFNYAKLSAELNFDQEAIQSFEEISPQSPYYGQSQEFLKTLLINTRDYVRAIETLESIPQLSPNLKEAYQKVTLARAMQLINDRRLADADKMLTQSLTHTPNPSLKAQALFWKGEIAHQQGDFDASIQYYNNYFQIASAYVDLPEESSQPLARYNQGYNYLKKEDYKSAQKQFESALSGLTNSSKYQGDYVQNRIVADATLRTGDCLFKQNRYVLALQYFDQSIDEKKNGFVYAIYQKAMIRGLQGQVFDKIALLEEIPNQYPQSQFADDALLELAITYQENGNPSKAIQTLEKITNQYAQNASLVSTAYLRLGLISYNNGDVNSALSYYKQIFNRNPEPQIAKEAMAAIEEIYIRDLGQPDAYVDFVDGLPGYNVSDFKKDSLAFVVAETKYENAQYGAAIASFTEYLHQFPNGVYKLHAYYQRGESYGVQKQFVDALADYRKVIEFGQSSFYERTLLKSAVISYNHTQQFEQAMNDYEALEKVATSDDRKFEAQLGAMRSAYRLNRSDVLSEMATKVIFSDKASLDNRATAHFYRGKIALRELDYEAALEDFNQVSRYTNNALTAESRYRIAQIYFDRGAFDIAKQLCLNVNKESGNYPEWVARSIILLSDIHVAEKDLFNARAALEAVIENFQGDEEIVNEAREKLLDIQSAEAQQSRISTEPGKTNQLQLIEKNNGNGHQ